MRTDKEREPKQKVTFMVKKAADFSEWYNTLVRQAEIIDDRYNLKGFVVYRPYGFFILRQIAKVIEEELERNGHGQVLFPILISEESLAKEEEHVEGFKAQVFWVTEGGDEKLEKRLALRPTSETAFYPLYNLWIRSISDLPLKLYQTTTVYRYETRATKPLVRGREFYWIEAHDAFGTEQEAMSQIKEDNSTLERALLETLGVPFLFLKRPRWDKFKGAVDTYAADVLMPDGKTLQVASTHFLGTNFSKAFEIKYQDKDGNNKHVFQTCFGPGVTRILASVISVHGDDRGLILPPNVAPTQVVTIPIPGTGVSEYARKVDDMLKTCGFRTKLDDGDSTPGEKFYKWEFLGVPFRVEIGSREVAGESVTLFNRVEFKREVVKMGDLVPTIRRKEVELLQTMRERARGFTESRTGSASSLKSVRDQMSSGTNVIQVPFCSTDVHGEDCASKLDELGLNVLGSMGEVPERGTKCIICGRASAEFVYLASSD